MLEAASKHIRAVVIGIDVYSYGREWDLRGPAADAMRTVDWLQAAQVQPEHIALFLSPASWESDKVKQWVQDRKWGTRRDALQHEIAEFLNAELGPLGGQALVVHWGGHGAIDDRNRHNYLFAADAKTATPHCFSAQDLLLTLADVKFSHLAQQVFIFDMCAGAFSSISDVQPEPLRLYKSHHANVKVRQCAMFAASLGEIAVNDNARETGLFSALIFEQLKARAAPTLAQFGEAFAAVKADGMANGLSKQLPRLQFKDPLDPEFEMAGAVPTLAGQDMLQLIRARKPAHQLIKRIYLQSLPILRHTGAESIEAWLRLLTEAHPRDEGYGAPLIEFAERLARATGDQSFSQWAKDNSEGAPYALVAQRLDEEQAIQKPIATLFIEIDSESTRQVHWWTEAPDPDHRRRRTSTAIGQRGLITELETCLPQILLQASSLTEARFRLRIGFIVPAALFSLGLESIRIDWDGDIFPLNQQYAVLFHWYDRTVRQLHRYVTNWKDVLQTLSPRVKQGGGAPVKWLDAAAANDPLSRYARASHELRASTTGAICLGIAHPPACPPDQSLGTVVECLRHGVPCLFWLQLPRTTPKKIKEIRDRVTTAFAKVDSATAPVAIWHGSKIAAVHEQIVPIGVVWDLPEFLPHDVAVPTRFEDTR
ncbi:MAG: caspase family protein [Massilia sp.]|uniref:VMAP-C domain-containing protein n=1 Tax=Massilia sp. TaxID=1882437 RepID=UPI002FC8848C